MANPIHVLPDAPLALIQYLRTDATVTGLVPAERITTSIPPTPTYPLVILQRAGGQAIGRGGIDDAAIQVSVFGGTQHECSKLIATIRAAILAIANDMVSEGTLVSASEEVGPQWFPDTATVPPLARFIARFSVLLHP